MNKAYGIAALVTGLLALPANLPPIIYQTVYPGHSIATSGMALAQEKKPDPVPTASATSAQAPDQPIKFGKNRDFLYERGNPDETFDFLFKFAKTAPSKGKNLGKFWIGQDDDFLIWGVLNDKAFKYSSDRDDVELQLVDQNYYVSLRNVPRKYFGKDSAEVSRRPADGSFPLQSYVFENADFYETPPLRKESQFRVTLKQIFANYERWLNAEEIRKTANRARISQPIPEPLRSTLENFLR